MQISKAKNDLVFVIEDRYDGQMEAYYNTVNGKVGLSTRYNKETKEISVLSEYKDGMLNGTYTRYRNFKENDVECAYEFNDDVLVRVISLRDNKGREHALGKGTIEVWKACKVNGLIPVYVRLEVSPETKRMTTIDNNHMYISIIEKA